MVNLFWLCKPKRVVDLASSGSKKRRRTSGTTVWDYSACARQHIDSHVIKIPLEAAQLLYGVHHKNPAQPNWIDSCPLTLAGNRGYRAAHVNNPISKWAEENLMHYRHVIFYGLALCGEYTYRYQRAHACEEHLLWLRDNEPAIACDPAAVRDPPLAMPEQYRLPSDPTVAPTDDYAPDDVEDALPTPPSQHQLPLSPPPPQGSPAPVQALRRSARRAVSAAGASSGNASSNASDDDAGLFSWQVYQSYRNYYLGAKLNIRMSGFGDRPKPSWVEAHLQRQTAAANPSGSIGAARAPVGSGSESDSE